jgi:C4-dicarboxylate transporter DctQ subunit
MILRRGFCPIAETRNGLETGMSLLTKITRFYNGILAVFVFIAGIMLIFLMLSVGLEVALRYFLGRPTSWVVEIAGYILLYIPFLVGAWILKKEAHVRMDLGLSFLGAKSQHLINTITSIIGAVICLILTAYGVKVSWYFLAIGYKTPTVLMLPQGLIVSIIFAGSFLLFIQFLSRAFSNYKKWKACRPQ